MILYIYLYIPGGPVYFVTAVRESCRYYYTTVPFQKQGCGLSRVRNFHKETESHYQITQGHMALLLNHGITLFSDKKNTNSKTYLPTCSWMASLPS